MNSDLAFFNSFRFKSDDKKYTSKVSAQLLQGAMGTPRLRKLPQQIIFTIVASSMGQTKHCILKENNVAQNYNKHNQN